MKQVQDVNRSSTRQVSRRLKPVPRRLGELMDLVNEIPPDLKLPEVRELVVCEPYDPYNPWCKVKEFIAQLSTKVQEFIGPIETYRAVFWNHQYTLLCAARELLTAIASHNPSKSEILMPPTGGLSYLELDSKGCLNFRRSELVDAFEGVEAVRIRQCSICRKFFWAGRVDRKCCSTQCNHARHNREWRRRYRAESGDKPSYKLQRYNRAEALQTKKQSNPRKKGR